MLLSQKDELKYVQDLAAIGEGNLVVASDMGLFLLDSKSTCDAIFPYRSIISEIIWYVTYIFN